MTEENIRPAGYMKPRPEELTTTDKAIIMERHMRSILKHSKHTVLAFIFDRTVWWNKEWEVITSRQIQSGITASDDRLVHAGTGLARSTISEALTSLHTDGFIKRRKLEKTYWRMDIANLYEYSICWEAILNTMEHIPMGLSINLGEDANEHSS